MKYIRIVACLALAGGLVACGEGQPAQPSSEVQPVSVEIATEGQPYQLPSTEVWSVPDPVSEREYKAFVYLPRTYESEPERRYPVLYLTDAEYGLPVARSIAVRVGDRGAGLEDFIIVGMSYAQGDDSRYSRNRDYTPVETADPVARKTGPHGGAEDYRVYIRDQMIPFVEGKYRTEPARRVFMGHSYGALLGTHIMFTEPAMFSTYILGSPSLWYANKHMMKVEADYAIQNTDLPASIFMYVGQFEAVRRDDPRYHKNNDMVADMREFERRLRSRNYASLKVASVVIEGEDHLTVFPAGFTRALKHVFPVKPGA